MSSRAVSGRNVEERESDGRGGREGGRERTDAEFSYSVICGKEAVSNVGRIGGVGVYI